MSDFDDVTAIRRREDSSDGLAMYDVDLHPGWSIGTKPNGGYLLAILARAGCDVVGANHPLAVSGHYLRAPEGAPAEVRTELVRQGRRVSTARATLWQGEKPFIDALVTSGELAGGDVAWVAGSAPEMPSPEDCPSAATPNFAVELFDHAELRVDPATAPFPEPTGQPLVRYWFRLRDGSEPSVLSLILAVDAGPPTVFNLRKYGWAPTVELTVLLRGIPAPGWLKCEVKTQILADGWFDEEATVWDSTGRLVAQSRQLALAGTR